MSSDPVAKASLRTRIVVPMILLAALTLIAAGTIVAVIHDRNTSRGIEQQMMRTRDELRLLADTGVDPLTGMAFAGPSELLETFLSRTVLSDSEGDLAFIDGEVGWFAPGDLNVQLEDDPELLEAVTPLTKGDEIVITSIHTAMGHYKVLVAPVVFPDARGALVHTYDTDEMTRQLRATMGIYAAAALGMLALVSLVAWPLVGRLLRPIEELRAAAESIDEIDLTTRVPVRGRDDLAALSGTINRMLDRVQNSVEAQRQLLDDVGHELRTPITVVRGHLEVVDAGDPEDVVTTRDLAIDELDRMGVLINDLLVLAKAGTSDFVTPEWTDLTSLTDQTFEKARTLGDRRWKLESVAASEAWVDPTRITQAWLQLAANAVKYSATGTAISLGSRLHRGEAQLWVTDEGTGIPADELDHVRERFGRSKGAPSQASGAGLGLSIVESIMAAHGGSLDIQSVEGVGSTFTLVLPLSPQTPVPVEGA